MKDSPLGEGWIGHVSGCSGLSESPECCDIGRRFSSCTGNSPNELHVWSLQSHLIFPLKVPPFQRESMAPGNKAS